MGKLTIRQLMWRGLIGFPIGAAYVFAWLEGYFDRPEYVAIGGVLAVLMLIGSIAAQRMWARRKRRLAAIAREKTAPEF